MNFECRSCWGRTDWYVGSWMVLPWQDSPFFVPTHYRDRSIVVVAPYKHNFSRYLTPAGKFPLTFDIQQRVLEQHPWGWGGYYALLYWEKGDPRGERASRLFWMAGTFLSSLANIARPGLCEECGEALVSPLAR